MPKCEVCGDELPELVPGEPAYGSCWWNAEQEFRRRREAGHPRVVYVEGWAIRRCDGESEPFEHGWVEIAGEIRDVTPHAHAERHFRAIECADPTGKTIPLYRNITCPATADGQPNPLYDPGAARAYAEAKIAADAYCASRKQTH